jgi:FKBP-type peptidyl-prolyl cis-trans isomerase
MSEEKFDDIIKGKLNNLTSPEVKDVWAAFEAKLNSTDNDINQNDQQFDKIVKDQLLSNRPKFKTEHWKLLKSELKTYEERKNTVVVSKILELAAVFLIVFTFMHLSGTFSKTPKSVQQSASQFAASETKNSAIKRPQSDLKTSSASQSPSVKVNQNRKSGIKYTGALINGTVSDMNAFEEQNVTAANIENNGYVASIDDIDQVTLATVENNAPTSIQNKDIAQNTPNVAELNHAESKTDIPNSALGNDQINTDFVPDMALSKTSMSDSLESNGDTELVKNIDFLPAKTIEPFQAQPEIASILPLHRSKKQPSTSISAWTATDVNLINTPFDKFYSLDSYTKEALNNSYGINIGSTKNNIELESGLGYSKRVYQPVIYQEAFGAFGDHYFEKSLNKISFDIASIPLNIKYHGIKGAGWNAYILAGASLNLIMNAEYDITETLIRGKVDANRYVPDQARLDSKPFIKGILNGEKFEDNYFATIGFGFGIEKTIFKNTSFYLQPSYFRHILSHDIGIGPNKDKIHTSSLQVGIKTSLN